MKRILFRSLLILAVMFGGVVTGANAKPPQKSPKQSYLVVSKANKLPTNIDNEIRRRGGKVTNSIPQLGVAVVETADLDFAAKASKIPNVGAVLPNLQAQWLENQAVEVLDADNLQIETGDDYHFGLQWSLQAIRAPQAWAQGHLGQNVLVAVLDTGFDTQHPDLKANIDAGLSKSFVGVDDLEYVPNDEPGRPDIFSHGTHVAGIIAAADNGIGTTGVAPEARLMLVKVLQDDGSGTFADVLAGMAYAADQRANVINMSFGAMFDTNGYFYNSDGKWEPMAKNDILEYRRLMGRAVTYANSKGALVVAAAGNNNVYRGSGSSLIILPADAQNAIGVSATSPIGWAIAQKDGQDAYLDYLALYTNYGQKLIDVAAPGGDYRLAPPPDDTAEKIYCTVEYQEKECWVFDMVISTGYSHDKEIPAYYWTAGTSMAAAHTSGVLALLIGKNDGKIPTGQATTRLYQSADDLAPAGKDEYFGAGRVNAANIVK